MTKDSQAVSVWALADFFRKEAPADWQPRSIEFERELEPVRAAGARWNVSLSVRAGGSTGEQFELAVMIEKDDPHGARGLSARRRLRLFEFLEAVEKRMWRLRYGGSFDIDRHDDEYSGYFTKYVTGTPDVRREIEKLAALRIGDRNAPAGDTGRRMRGRRVQVRAT